MKKAIKIIISVVLLAIVFSRVSFGGLLDTLATIRYEYVAVVVVAYLMLQGLSSIKWWILARASGIDVPYATAFRAYFIGMFVNCFGLGMVGGDVTRGILISEGRAQKARGLATVVADRLHGLSVLAAIGLLSALVVGHQELPTQLLLILIALGVAIPFSWAFGPTIALKILPKKSKIYQVVEDLSAAFPHSIAPLLSITAISIVFHVLQIGLHWVMGLSLGLSIEWHYLFVTIPFVNILSSLPISWQGLGVRERAYLFFLSPAVLSPEHAVTFGAIWLFAMTVSSCMGGFVALVTKDFNAEFSDKETTAKTGDEATSPSSSISAPISPPKMGRVEGV